MLDGKTISIGRVIESAYRDSAFSEHIDYSDAVEWCFSLLKQLGISSLYERKTACLDIEDYSAPLPCDYYVLQNVRDYESGITMPQSTNISYTPDCDGNVSKYEGGFGHKISMDRVYVSFKEGKIYLDYDAVAVGEDGLPLIPEDEKLVQALKDHIIEKVARKLYQRNIIPKAVFDDIKQEAVWSVAACRSKASVPSYGGMQSLYNIWVRLAASPNATRYGMQYANYPERLQNFNTKQ